MGYGSGVTDYRAQASNIYNKVKAMFNENQLKLSSNTNIETKGPEQEKELLSWPPSQALLKPKPSKIKRLRQGKKESPR